MHSLWHTVDGANNNVIKLLSNRERHEEQAKALQQSCQFTAPLLKRFGLDYNLEGHKGCVNCLQWNADGSVLASGSDDTHVMLWDPLKNKNLNLVATKHIGNIFSVKFVGDGSLVATGAGDCRVIVTAINDSDRQPIVDCNCHIGRVKRLAVAPDEPSLFWSAAEDGLVLQYDLREHHECRKKSTIFVDLTATTEFKCIAVNPTKSHLIAIGGNDSYVRLYDRRMVKTSRVTVNYPFHLRKRPTPPDSMDTACVQYYSPGHLARDNGGENSYKLSATYITFNTSGSELLVNMGGEHVYLFDVNHKRPVNQLRIPACLQNQHKIKSSCEIDCKTNGKTIHKHNYKINNKNPCACDFMSRASRIFKRKWIGDVYYAARDYFHVIQEWPSHEPAYLGLIECLIALKWADEASAWIKHFETKFTPTNNHPLKILQETLANIPNTPHEGASSGIDELFDDVDVIEPIYEQRILCDDEKTLRANSCDYERRFIGHCNTTTDIKEANFLGDDFICAGSDDGVIFVWDKKTTNLLTALLGDVSIVNCVQPHPSICCLASSGIDPVVKIWSPKNEDLDKYENIHVIGDPWFAVEANQDRMSMNSFETMLADVATQHYTNSRIRSPIISGNCRTS